MKRSRMIAAFSFMTLMVTLVSQAQKKPSAASASNTISASGYVTAGVEAGCLMLQDYQTKTLYNLLFGRKKQPALGDAIHFTGTKHNGPTTCMQGEAVDVQNGRHSKQSLEVANKLLSRIPGYLQLPSFISLS